MPIEFAPFHNLHAREMKVRHRARAAARAWWLVALGLLLASSAVAAQQDSTTVVPGARYRARSPVHQLLLGRNYRDLWTTPIRVAVLDLNSFAGGLTPVRTGGDRQTRSIRFRAGDGREYNFRSIDKEISAALPEFMRETAVDWLLQDLTSAQLPTAPIVATSLLDAVGILNPAPTIVALPDDESLGGLRDAFGGMLGTLEVHPDEGENGEPLFAGSPLVVDTENMLDRLEESPQHRVDARTFVRARLLDALLGDFDRHAGQWRWARSDRDGLHWWIPVPEDRDYAFVDYHGLLPAIARQSVAPRLVRFRDRYPNLLALQDNSLDLNRRLLAGVTGATWDSEAEHLQKAITDQVIHDAVRQLPPAHRERQGGELTRKLIQRRNALREMAAAYYRLLAQNVEIHATDQRDHAEIVRQPDGEVRVRLFSGETQQVEEPYFVRTFFPSETNEVRVFLHGGDDHAVIRGESGPIVVRVVGGGGDDVLEDQATGRTVLYDSRGADRFSEGPRTRISRLEHREQERSSGMVPSLTRDWGQRRSILIPWVGWEPHAELVVGGGPSWTRFAFRHSPYAWKGGLRGLFAPLHQRVGAELRVDIRWEDSSRSLLLLARASNLQGTTFHGFGNDSPRLPRDLALVWHDRYLLQAGLGLPWSSKLRAEIGGLARYTTSNPAPGGPLAAEQLFGSRPLGQVGIRADLGFRSPINKNRLELRSAEVSGMAYPPLWDLRTPYGTVVTRLEVAAPLGNLPGAQVVVRAGANASLGEYPYFDAAFLGGWQSLRGYPLQRFAGDQAVFGGAEVRIPITPVELLVRGDLGIALFSDVGRVSWNGRSPAGWHNSAGAYAWFSTPVGELAAGYARGEGNRFYLRIEPGT